jgi:UDP-N-acetylmuramate dehydrogenase
MEELVLENIRGQLRKNVNLTDYSSWRTGGCADYLYIPHDLPDLIEFLQSLTCDIPVTWLGLGSNTLIRDSGVEGVVIITQGALQGLSVTGNIIRAEAGVACAQLARFSARLGLTGLEFLAGIPGTVGGALKMNAGCFGGETWHNIQAVEMINRTGQITTRTKKDFTVSYRHVASAIEEWFVAGLFELPIGAKEQSLQQIRDLLARRNATQPTGTANCGSVFKNPPGDYAGRLIEQCGLKGKSYGGAHVSEKHANFIINDNNANAQDIENLINEIKTIVEQKTSVRLIPEVCIIGRRYHHGNQQG